ncbi:hypothetical protein A4X06_0g9134, partial [Tilletia controversa]
ITTNPTWNELILHDVLHVPELDCNLVSVVKLNQDYLRVEFTEQLEALITDPFQRDFTISATWSWQSQAYLLPVVGSVESAYVSAFVLRDDERSASSGASELATPTPSDQVFRLWVLWHPRLGHLGNSSLPILAQNSVGLPASLIKRSATGAFQCEICSLTNIKRLPFSASTTKSTRPLELVHADLTGRVICKSLGGAEYLAILVDDYTRMLWVLPLVQKSDFVLRFIEWRDQVVPYKGPVACLRTDGGGEFNNAALRAALAGARHERSCAYTSQQNGVAERYVGIVKSVMRPLLHGRHLPLEYWAEAAATAAYVRNRCPSTANDGKTPFELWHGTKPNLADLRVFGCLAFPMLSTKAREHSLAVRSRPGVFIGYDTLQKGYRIHFPDTKELVVTRNVDFHEDKGYDFSSLVVAESEPPLPPEVVVSSAPRPPGLRPRLVVIGPRQPDPAPSASVDVELPAAAAAPPPAAPPPLPPVSAPAPGPAPAAAPAAPSGAPRSSASVPSASVGAQAPAAAPGARPRPPPTRQYQTRQHTSRMEQGRQQRETSRAVLSMSDSFASAFHVQLSADGIELEPKTLKDAMRRSDWAQWLQAMREEMESHSEMGTWVLEKVPDDRELVGSRWVFKLKLDSEGAVSRYKARLVAQGFSQIFGVDYNETYSPVTRFVTIRTLLALAAYFGWQIHQLDVVTAYLYGKLETPVYMRQPPGFELPGQEHLCCRLIRSLYGLKQSGREWYFTLRAALIELGFEQSAADPAIFIFGQGTSAIIVAVYVDDVLVLGSNTEEIDAVKTALGKRFKMKDQGQIGHFLGMKIERSEDSRSFFISQSAYIRSMLERFNYKDIKAAPSPLDPKQRLQPYDGSASDEDRRRFQAMLGCLMWLAQASRSDLSYAVSTLARHASNPGPQHFG